LTATGSNSAIWQPCLFNNIKGSVTTIGNQSTIIASLPTIDNCNYLVECRIIGRLSAGGSIGNTYVSLISCCYKRLTGHQSLIQVQNDTKSIFKDPGVGWSVSSQNNITTRNIDILVQGATGATIIWSCSLEYIQN
jgi:hypothetical protein